MTDTIAVEVAGMKTASKGQRLVTYSLGSCIGLSAYDPQAGVGGLLHLMLPDSRINALKGSLDPYMFADTGIERLFKAMENRGCRIGRLVLKAAGGANLMDPQHHFDIGRRNYLAVKRILWENSLTLSGEDVGGSVPRSVFLDVTTGKTAVKYPGACNLVIL